MQWLSLIWRRAKYFTIMPEATFIKTVPHRIRWCLQWKFFMHYCTFGRNIETCFNLCKWKRIFFSLFLSFSSHLIQHSIYKPLYVHIHGAYPRICLCKFYILALINDGRLLKYIYANGLNLRSYKALVFDTKTHKLYVYTYSYKLTPLLFITRFIRKAKKKIFINFIFQFNESLWWQNLQFIHRHEKLIIILN